MVFLYGYFYAQNIVIFSIVIVFAATVPLITITGLLFFSMKHIVDSFNLLTVNRKETESSPKVFRHILLAVLLSLLIS